MNEPDLVIEGVNLPAMRLILQEAAAVLRGHAERMHALADDDDWKSKTTAFMTDDHVKKLYWVYSFLKQPRVNTP